MITSELTDAPRRRAISCWFMFSSHVPLWDASSTKKMSMGTENLLIIRSSDLSDGILLPVSQLETCCFVKPPPASSANFSNDSPFDILSTLIEFLLKVIINGDYHCRFPLSRKKYYGKRRNDENERIPSNRAKDGYHTSGFGEKTWCQRSNYLQMA
jgi:hypothetical protein